MKEPDRKSETTRHQCSCRDCSPGTCGMDGVPHCVNCCIKSEASATAKPARLTKSQREFLAELAKAPRGAWHKYSPALKLVELGLATSGDERYGTVRFTITDAGRSVL